MFDKLTLVVVDDSARDRSFLAECLDDYAVVMASDAQQALAACTSAAPFLITDIQMPGINGVELARNLWSQKPEARLLFWSQFNDEVYVRALASLVPPQTVYGYVLKTNSADVLSRAAHAVFHECQCWIDPQVRPVQARAGRTGFAITDAEYEVLIDIALGLTDNAIAMRHYLSRRGVQNRLRSLYDKLGANDNQVAGRDGEIEMINNRARAVAIAFQRGLINPFELEREEQQLHAWMSRL